MSVDDKVHPHAPTGHEARPAHTTDHAAQAAHMAHLGHAAHPQPPHAAPHAAGHHDASHAHPHPHPHGPARKAKPVPPKSEGGWLSRLALAVAAAAVIGGGWWAYDTYGGPSESPEERLLTEMQDAAKGAVVPTHALGGALKVNRERGLTVTAYDLPVKACVSAGWRLSKLGVISVNGFTPNRLSAAKLSELCGASSDGAALTWKPD